MGHRRALLTLLTLLMVMLAGVAHGFVLVSLRLAPVPEHGVAVLEDGAGHVGTFTMQRSGLALVYMARDSGAFVVRISSQSHRFPVVALQLEDGRVSAAVADTPLLSASPGVFVVNALGQEVLYAERVPFSWYGLATSPIVLMGAATLCMMGLMQLLLAGVDLDDIKREMRGDPRADESGDDDDDEDGADDGATDARGGIATDGKRKKAARDDDLVDD